MITTEVPDFSTISDALQTLPSHLLPPCKYEYKGGARYYGEIADFKRQGKGIMSYPDGDLFEGYFSDGVREGTGTQKWLDGAVYQGPFKQDKRHGRGIHQWVNGEVYEGDYEQDKRSGNGKYTWPNGDKFEGAFSNDAKHGFGKFYFNNGNVFEGEYECDERLGRGIMQYKNKTQDIGSWRGCSLLKLDKSVLPASLLDIADTKQECDLCDMREVTKGFEVKRRSASAKPKGALETASEALLLSSLRGDSAASVYLLHHTCVRPDISDCNGLTPLLAASVFCRNKVVNILLNNGADVNQLSDAGISPLVACHLHLYYNLQCGYDIQHRLGPLYPCKPEDQLDGPIEAFEHLQLSTQLNEELEGTMSEASLHYDVPDIKCITQQIVSRDSSYHSSSSSEPSGTDYTTVVVYGKRYFVRGEDILGNLDVPPVSTLPSEADLRETIKLLLKRGADPKIGTVPVPALILAIIARDVEAVELLLKSGADPTARLVSKYGCKSPLHVAAGLLGPGASAIVELLLTAGADPNVQDDLSFSRIGGLQWKLAKQKDREGTILGSTPLQVACSMDQDYQYSTEVIKLLLAHNADTNVVCSGHSPLTLTIYSGNDRALEILLKSGSNPSLSLGSPIGSAMCAVVDTAAEHRRTNDERLTVINELMSVGADIMALVPIGKSGKHLGTAVDYAMHVFYQDKRIAHTPFHALTPIERDIYIARTNLLSHMATLLRDEVQLREAVAKEEEENGSDFDVEGRRTQKPKILFKYCYECGRSAGVKLTPCTRCYHVSFCSQRCKLKAWTSRHRRECIKLENKQKDKKDGRLPDLRNKKPPKQEPKSKAEVHQKPHPTIQSASKQIFGKQTAKKHPHPPKEGEVISHTLPRLVNLQHSQL